MNKIKKIIIVSAIFLLCTITNVNAMTLSEYLVSKANDTSVESYLDGNVSEMYTFDHEATEQTGELTDYRYIGNEPNNYVYFNCEDDNDLETCEVWRIIGVFEVEDENGQKENRVKLIRGGSLSSSMAWNSKWNNEWATASLKTYLNDGEYYDSLSESAKAMIGEAKYYLGGIRFSEPKIFDGNEYYKLEKGTDVGRNNTINWTGRIGLIYPSDYVYTYALGVDSKCYTDGYRCYNYYTAKPESGWIFNSHVNGILWTITPSIVNTMDYVFFVYGGRIVGGNADDTSDDFSASFGGGKVSPVVYLTSDIYVLDGDGSETNPYVLSLSEKVEESNGSQDNVDIPSVENSEYPATGDNLFVYIMLFLISFISFKSFTRNRKKNIKG